MMACENASLVGGTTELLTVIGVKNKGSCHVEHVSVIIVIIRSTSDKYVDQPL